VVGPRSAISRPCLLLAVVLEFTAPWTLRESARVNGPHFERAVSRWPYSSALIVLPFIGLHVPWAVPGTLDIVNSTGTLEVLALCFMFAGTRWATT